MKKENVYFMSLVTVFVVAIVTSNVVSARILDTGLTIFGLPLIVPGGFVTYAFSFLATDIIGEIWGRKRAMSVVKYGFIGQLFSTFCILITGATHGADPETSAAFDAILGCSWVFVIGSLVAYYASQIWDVYIFHRLRDWYTHRRGLTEQTYDGRGRWIWNNVSTMTSQIIDTALFIGISFGFGFGWFFNAGTRHELWGMFIAQYLLKWLCAALDTPIFYLCTRMKIRRSVVIE